MNPPIASSITARPEIIIPDAVLDPGVLVPAQTGAELTIDTLMPSAANTELVVAPSSVSEVVAETKRSRVGNFISRQKTKALLGLTAVSTAVTLALDPFSETKEAVLDAAPWVAGGIAVSEAAFVAGAAMMLSAVGSEVPRNPLKIKEKIDHIAQKANDSRLFKAGFVVNTAGALGDFLVLSAGVTRELPIHSWGMLGFSLADLGVTIAVRKAIINGVHKHSTGTVQQ